MKYVITRQLQWPTGELVVEVSTGGMDYTNPDALAPMYPNEMVELTFKEVEQSAINIVEKWQTDINSGKTRFNGKTVKLGFGSTLGFTMPFQGEEFDKEILKEFKQWLRNTNKE